MNTLSSNYEKLKELIESPSFEDRELGFLLFNQIREATIFPSLELGNSYFVQGRSGSPDRPLLCKMWRRILEYSYSSYGGGPLYFADQQGNNYFLFPVEILSINAL